jgi:hypothetical protein
MCAKLKCCLNYEVDEYIEARKKLPGKDFVLETQEGEYYLFKTDILSGICTYSSDRKVAANLETITAERAHEVIEMNKKGEKPLSLQPEDRVVPEKKPADLLANDDISRFDKTMKRKKKKGQNKKQNAPKAQKGAGKKKNKEQNKEQNKEPNKQ